MVSNVGGYVLAGGKSSRMGRDKALLELGGRPLVAHVVAKLRRVCAEVHILGSRPELAVYAPLVQDLHEGCGPLGGMEAALVHSPYDWNLFMPVDMPFLPSTFLDAWVKTVIGRETSARVAMFVVGDWPQPMVCLLHQEVAPYVQRSVGKGELKVYPVLEEAGRELAAKRGLDLGCVFIKIDESAVTDVTDREVLGTSRHLWFANLNTPEEFAEAERHLDALDF
jgi:molybdopterin-guanine dinucleotide biosynthesis protein A